MIILLISLSLLAQCVWIEGLCVPDCTGASEGDKVQDPTNCLRYYYCSDPEGDGVMVPSAEPSKCEDGYYFDNNARKCLVIIPEDNYCRGLCNPCILACDLPGTLIPYARDCNKYLICLESNETITSACPSDNPFFDYNTGLCTDDPNLCYDVCDSCETYCTAPGKVPNPEDCNGYYYCDPPHLSPFSCPDGEVFNVDSLVCEGTMDGTGNCTTLCEY